MWKLKKATVPVQLWPWHTRCLFYPERTTRARRKVSFLEQLISIERCTQCHCATFLWLRVIFQNFSPATRIVAQADLASRVEPLQNISRQNVVFINNKKKKYNDIHYKATSNILQHKGSKDQTLNLLNVQAAESSTGCIFHPIHKSRKYLQKQQRFSSGEQLSGWRRQSVVLCWNKTWRNWVERMETRRGNWSESASAA